MFVKIEFEYSELILNIDNIVSIQYTKPIDRENYKYEGGYCIYMNDGKSYSIDKKHYDQLCEILTKRL